MKARKDWLNQSLVKVLDDVKSGMRLWKIQVRGSQGRMSWTNYRLVGSAYLIESRKRCIIVATGEQEDDNAQSGAPFAHINGTQKCKVTTTTENRNGILTDEDPPC